MPQISLDTLIPHGKARTVPVEGGLEISTSGSITSIAYNLTGDSYKRHFLELPERAHIPFALDMELELEYGGLILLVGEGHILFNCPCSRSVEDPVKPTGKALPKGQTFENHLPLGRPVRVTVRYGREAMQVLVEGREAFYTANPGYKKAAAFPECNEQGFRIGWEVAKLSTLRLRKVSLEPGEEPFQRPEPYIAEDRPAREQRLAAAAAGLPAYDRFLANFPEDICREIRETDALLRSLKPLNAKRAADAGGDKLTYTAPDFGASYGIRCSCGESWQFFGFYVVVSGKAETWHRKADYMEELLEEIAQEDPELARRVFYAMNDCIGCYGSHCIVKTPYRFRGEKKLVCHGDVILRLCPQDFEDVRAFFRYMNDLAARKVAQGTRQTEAIYMLKR